MGIQYHAFNCKLNIFFTLVLIFGLAICTPAHADGTLFTIKDVKVDVTADNAVMAQDKAFAQAQAQAFDLLKKRMVEENEIAQIKTPQSDTLANFVRDYEVTNEKISSVRYIGTYTFRFDPKSVRDYMTGAGVRFTEVQSQSVLLIPAMTYGNDTFLWSARNIWMDAWSRSPDTQGLVPIQIPIGDLMDISDIDDKNILRYQANKLKQMMARYNAKETAIMIAVPDSTLASITGDGARASGRLTIKLYRNDRGYAEHTQDIIFDAQNNESRSDLYARAVAKIYKHLQHGWKNKVATKSSDTQNFTMRIPYRKIQEWSKIKKSLYNVSGIQNVDITSVKQKEVFVTLTFRGSVEHLREAMAQRNLSLGTGYDNGANPLNATQSQLTYDVTYQPYDRDQSFYRASGHVPGQGHKDVETFGVQTF